MLHVLKETRGVEILKTHSPPTVMKDWKEYEFVEYRFQKHVVVFTFQRVLSNGRRSFTFGTVLPTGLMASGSSAEPDDWGTGEIEKR
ncbi:MAG: hypothetical protein WDM89_19900 [Rhizomicrobium sp.]